MHSKILQILPCASLFGCGFGLDFLDTGNETGVLDTESDADTDADSDADADADADSDTDADSDADAISVTAVSPAYGTTAGNASVTITGGPFDSSASVRFGGNAATIDSVTASEINVRTPSASAEGAVDVTVSTDSGNGSLTSGFYYIADGAGKAGLIGTLEWYNYNGNYWGSPPPTDYGFGYFTFIEAVTFDYSKFYSSSLDTCQSEYTYAGPDLYVYDFGVSTASLTAPDGSAVSFPWDTAGGVFEARTITNAQFQQGGSYDLQTITSTSFPPFSMTGVLRTPMAFNVTTPAINGSSAPRVSRSGLNLSWTGTGGSFILVQLGMWNSGGSGYQETVTCALTDDGSFSVPSGVWTSWPTNRQLDVIVGRATEGTGTVPYNNADTAAVGIYWNYGAGFTQ